MMMGEKRACPSNLPFLYMPACLSLFTTSFDLPFLVTLSFSVFLFSHFLAGLPFILFINHNSILNPYRLQANGILISSASGWMQMLIWGRVGGLLTSSPNPCSYGQDVGVYYQIELRFQ
jgi:hypothetical protein